VPATSDDAVGTSTSAGDDGDGDGTFGDTVTQTATFTSGDATSASAQDSGGSGDVTSTDDGDSSPFLIEPDGGSDFLECDIWIDDCPRGTKCMPWANDGGSSWNATRCSPLAEDPNDVGEPCSIPEYFPGGIDDCGPRSMCWDVDPDTLIGECVAFCTGSESSPSCDDPCTTCRLTGAGVLILCLPVCDPLAPDCDEGEACYPVDDSFECAPDAGGDMGALGEPCEFLNVCDPGLFCAPVETVPDCEGSGCCTPFCDALAEAPCAGLPGGVECIPWFDEGEAPPCVSGVVGACLLPE